MIVTSFPLSRSQPRMFGRHNLRRGSVAIARPAVTFSRGPGGAAAADIDLFFVTVSWPRSIMGAGDGVSTERFVWNYLQSANFGTVLCFLYYLRTSRQKTVEFQKKMCPLWAEGHCIGWRWDIYYCLSMYRAELIINISSEYFNFTSSPLHMGSRCAVFCLVSGWGYSPADCDVSVRARSTGLCKISQ